jgi:hypothetical protein
MRSVSFGEGEKGEKTHAEAEASDERKGAATPDGNHRNVEGPVFGADLYGYYLFRQVSYQHRRRQRERTGTVPLKMGHGPLVVMYPESLSSKLS